MILYFGIYGQARDDCHTRQYDQFHVPDIFEIVTSVKMYFSFACSDGSSVCSWIKSRPVLDLIQEQAWT